MISTITVNMVLAVDIWTWMATSDGLAMLHKVLNANITTSFWGFTIIIINKLSPYFWPRSARVGRGDNVGLLVGLTTGPGKTCS